jgi:hypothetical protein
LGKEKEREIEINITGKERKRDYYTHGLCFPGEAADGKEGRIQQLLYTASYIHLVTHGAPTRFTSLLVHSRKKMGDSHMCE